MGEPATTTSPPGGATYREVILNPTRTALLFAGLFLVFSAVYIQVSSRVAATYARSVEQLQHIETFKGFAFIAVCSVFLFFLSRHLLRRIARDHEDILAHRNARLAAERRATAGIFASTVAHDMNNILTVGVAMVDMLRNRKDLNPDQASMISDIEATFTRMTDLTRRLSSMGRAGLQGEFRNADLVDVVRQEIEFTRRHARLRANPISLTCDGAIHMSACPQILQQMLANLLLNAADATLGEGHIDVRVSRQGNQAILEIHDSGPGIPADARSQVFDPFFTTKPHGNGLGLLSVKAAVQMHRGRVEIVDSPLGGACFRVTLPISGSAAPAGSIG